jgi:hypothetical protein
LILIEQILPGKRAVENYYVEFDQLPDGMLIFQAVPVEPVFKPFCQEFDLIGHPGLFLLF